MKKNKPTRPSADQTRAAILKAAKRQFLKYGFDGTTIDRIAKAAKVHTNLIFHHFVNKENLWMNVKEWILSQCPKATYDQSTAMLFFESVLDYRFGIYAKDPDLVKLIQWQQLTENESLLIGSKPYSPNDWLHSIRKFQKKGKIIQKIRAEDIMLFIIFSSYAPFMQHMILFDAKQQKAYKKMILNMCCQQFLTPHETR